MFGFTLLTSELKVIAARTGKEAKMVYQAKDETPLVVLQALVKHS